MRRAKLGVSAGVLACAVALSTPVHAVTVTLLHNNDGESKLLGSGSGANVAYFKALVDQEKAASTSDATFMISSGDNFLASPAFNASLNSGTFYDAQAITAIGYDAIVLGNHDFDFGPQVLADFIGQVGASATYLSSNLDFSAEASLQNLVDSGRIKKSIILEQNGVKVGVVGATTPLLPTISSPGGVVVGTDLVNTVQQEIDDLEAQGVNQIVFVSHLQSVNEDKALIAQLSGVDIAIAGGGDELLATVPPAVLLPGDTAQGPYPTVVKNADNVDVPIVTTSGEYKYLGKLEVEFDNAGNLVSFAGNPIRNSTLDGLTPDANLVSTVVDPVQQYVNNLAANIIATSEEPLNGRRGSFDAGVDGVRVGETNLGNLVADSLLWQAQQLAAGFNAPTPLVGIQNGGGIRNNNIIPAGDISEKTTFDILPFANFVAIVPDVTPDVLKAVLENAVSRVEFTDGRFAQISGLYVTYDLSRQGMVIDTKTGNILDPGSRILDVYLSDGTPLILNGQIVPGAPTIAVATIDFLARETLPGLGGDSYPWASLGFIPIGVTYQQALFNYITASTSEGGLGGTIGSDQYGPGVARRLYATPEPVTAASALMGLLALAGVGTRRRRA